MTAAGLFLIASALIMWGTSALAKNRKRQAAMRRHPATVARKMSDAEARYHGSDQWGR